MRLLASVIMIFALFSATTAIGQAAPVNSIGARWHGGFLFAHHPDMRHLVTGHFNALELHYQRRFSGAKDWHHAYRIPEWGISALGIPALNDQIGSAYALFPYYNLPLTLGEKVILNLKLGAGLGLLTERFDRIDNHKNIAIATQINAALQLGLDLTVRLHPRIDWNSGLFITHFSNGAVRMPNLGLNFITASSGLAYRFGEEQSRTVEKKKFPGNKNVRWSLFAGAGLKQAQVLQGDVKPAATLQLLAEKRLSWKFSLGAGAEFNYNAALPLAYEAKSLTTDQATPIRGGLLIGSAFHFGRMDIIAQVGAYVLDPGLIDGRIFNRFGIRHQVGDRFKLNLTLRTHYAKADHFELGVVYRLSML